MAFCSNCGRPTDTVDQFCGACGKPIASAQQSAAPIAPPTVAPPSVAPPPAYADAVTRTRSVPAEVILVALGLVAGALFVLVPSIRLMVSAAPGLKGDGFGRDFTVLFLVLSLVLVSIGIALVAIAWMLIRGDKVGRALACIVAAAVAIAEIATSQRTVEDNWAMALSIAVLVALLVLPGARAFFAQADDRPTAVITAVVVIGFIAWDFGLTGLAMLPLSSSEEHLRAYGVGLLIGSALLLLVNRAMSVGQAWARAVSSVLLAVVAALVIAAEHRTTAAVLLAAVAAGTVGFLWLSESANAYFSQAAPTATAPRRVLASRAQAIGAVIGVVVIAAAAIATFRPSSSAQAADSFAGSNAFQSDSPVAQQPAGPLASFDHTWTISETLADGGSAQVVLRVGDPQPYSSGLSNGGDTLGDACTDDGSTAVLPFQLISTNNSPQPETVGISFEGVGSASIPAITGPGLSVEADFSSGEQCIGQDDGSTSFNEYSTNPLTQGLSNVMDGFFVITDYYNGPEPAATILDDAKLTVTASNTFDSDAGLTATVTSVDGPDVGIADGEWLFSVGGS